MANVLIDNTYIVTDSSATALAWPSNAIINTVVFHAINTSAVALFVYPASLGSVTTATVLRFSVITQGAGTSIMQSVTSVDMGRTRFNTAWVPTTLTACTAWIHFA